MQVNMHTAKSTLSQLADRAKAGEDIVIAKAGKPWVRLVPYEALPSPRQPGMLKSEHKLAEDSVWFEPDPDMERLFMGDEENLD